MRQMLAVCCLMALAFCVATLLVSSAKLQSTWYLFSKRSGIRPSDNNHENEGQTEVFDMSNTLLQSKEKPKSTLISSLSENYETISSTTSLERFGLKNIVLLRPRSQPRPSYKFLITPNAVEGVRRFSGSSMACSIVVMVKSIASNTGRRMAIRNTWGSVKYLDGLVVETVFIVGINDTVVAPSMLVEEAEKYGDILAFHGEDVYEKLYHKIFSGIQWASEKFPTNWLIASSDDDVVLHVKKFRDDLNAILSDIVGTRGHTKNACSKLPIFCAYRLVPHARPLRSRASKWCVDPIQYPLPVYPPYCLGAFYAMPLVTAGKILNISRNLPEFKIDDVWITGILRMALEAWNSLDSPEELFQLVRGGDSVHHVWDSARNKDNFSVADAIGDTWKRWKVTDDASEFFMKKP